MAYGNKKGVALMSGSFWLWCHQESNRGHKANL